MFSAQLRRHPHDHMKQKLIRLSQQYVTTLRRHLQPGARALPPGETALSLGRQMVACGLETLDLARMHEQALATLELSKSKNGEMKRAQIFFTEANAPIEATHRPAQQSQVRFREF